MVWALAAETLNLSVTVDLVVLEDGELHLLALVLDLLWGGVDLLLALLGSSTESQDEVKGGLLLDVVIGKSAAILELLACEDQALLVRWNSLLVLDLGLDIVDGVGRLNLEGDGLTREGLNEDLHDCLLRSKSQRRGLEGLGLEGEHFGAVDQKKRERKGREEERKEIYNVPRQPELSS